MNPPLLARFTPSLTRPADLEAIFVQREPLATRLGEQLRDSLTTGNKHHTLLVGPRGSGKSHLVTLVHHRLVNQAELRPLCLVAWLREEEWGVMSFTDLLHRILRALRDGREAPVPPEQTDVLHDLSPAAEEAAAIALLQATVGDKTLVLLVENLDDIFAGLVEREQRAFRAWVQNFGRVTILATTPGLFDAVARQKSPFFGFFRTHHLEELKLEDAALLLRKIAMRRGQTDLVEFMQSAAGRARVRAIHHLAQGNPRVYVILSEFLTRQSLDELLGPVLRMLDDLTPYYQARLSALSRQQRRMVEFLARHRVPCRVKEIARRCGMTQQTASGQLRKLNEGGCVRSQTLGREVLYELREPLLRFCLDLKRERREPLRPLVEILRIWWTEVEMEERINELGRRKTPTAEYLSQALALCRHEPCDPRVEACRRDFAMHYNARAYDQAYRAAEEWIAISKNEESMLTQIGALLALEKWETAQALYQQTKEMYPESLGVHCYGAWIAFVGLDPEKAVEESRLARKLDEHKLLTNNQLAQLHYIEARALEHLREYKKAAVHFARAARLDGCHNYFYHLACCQMALGHLAQAEESLLSSLIYKQDSGTRLMLAGCFCLEQKWANALAELNNALGLSAQEVNEERGALHQMILYSFFHRTTIPVVYIAEVNAALRRHNLPEIQVLEIVRAEICHLESAPKWPVLNGLEDYLSKEAQTDECTHALQLLKAAREFATTRDEAVLLRLPLEERQLLTDLRQVASAPAAPSRTTPGAIS